MTANQQRLLGFIRSYQESNKGVSPSIREISLGVGIKGQGSIHRQLVSLEDQGKIRRVPSRARRIELLDDKPILSQVVASAKALGLTVMLGDTVL